MLNPRLGSPVEMFFLSLTQRGRLYAWYLGLEGSAGTFDHRGLEYSIFNDSGLFSTSFWGKEGGASTTRRQRMGMRYDFAKGT